MAGEERTEAATPRRLQKLREQGRVVKSTDLIAAAGLLAGFVALQQFGSDTVGSLGWYARDRFSNLAAFGPGGQADLTDAALNDLARSATWVFFLASAPLLIALPIAAIVSTVGQTGLLFSSHSLKPDFNHINPASGWQRMFSVRSLVEMGKSIIKIVLIGYVLYRVYMDSVPILQALSSVDATASSVRLADTALGLCYTLGGAFLAFAVLDYAYQRWEFIRSARMTRQEVKDEYRESEGSPQIKAAIRKRQRAMARARMMQNIPTADVVITNPTHLAIAIAYRAEEMGAPKVVAKGADLVAARIRQIAEQHNVPLVENKPLARTLYSTVDLDEEIPLTLFQAVAEILAYIYALKTRRSGSATAMS